MPRWTKKEDSDIIEIAKILTRGIVDPEGHWSEDQKMHWVFGYGRREVYRRKVVSRCKVSGDFWLQGEGSEDGLLKKSETRTLRPGLFLYVRKDDLDPDFVDIEAQFDLNAGTRWMVATISVDEYMKISAMALAPYEHCCKERHKNDFDPKTIVREIKRTFSSE